MAKKRFGQHFLSDPKILQRIVRFAEISASDTVIEIGPGVGALTAELAATAQRVIAIEIDRDLIGLLRERMPANVEVIEADALESDFSTFSSEPLRLVGNLPYNIATPLFKRFIEFRSLIPDLTVMIQKEVAERIIAKPDDEAYGPLSVLIQYYGVPRYGFTVPPGAFRPKPKVDSAVIRLQWRDNTPAAPAFTDFVHQAFGSRRKKLVNNLLHILNGVSRNAIVTMIERANVPAAARPENLSVDDFLRLYNQVCERRPGDGY